MEEKNDYFLNGIKILNRLIHKPKKWTTCA